MFSRLRYPILKKKNDPDSIFYPNNNKQVPGEDWIT